MEADRTTWELVQYGLTARASVHWIVPIIGLTILCKQKAVAPRSTEYPAADCLLHPSPGEQIWAIRSFFWQSIATSPRATHYMPPPHYPR